MTTSTTTTTATLDGRTSDSGKPGVRPQKETGMTPPAQVTTLMPKVSFWGILTGLGKSPGEEESSLGTSGRRRRMRRQVLLLTKMIFSAPEMMATSSRKKAEVTGTGHRSLGSKRRFSFSSSSNNDPSPSLLLLTTTTTNLPTIPPHRRAALTRGDPRPATDLLLSATKAVAPPVMTWMTYWEAARPPLRPRCMPSRLPRGHHRREGR